MDVSRINGYDVHDERARSDVKNVDKRLKTLEKQYNESAVPLLNNMSRNVSQLIGLNQAQGEDIGNVKAFAQETAKNLSEFSRNVQTNVNSLREEDAQIKIQVANNADNIADLTERVDALGNGNIPETGDGETVVTWENVTGKPETFPPDEHSHDWNSVTEKPDTFPPDEHSHSWESVTGKPETFPPSEHTHVVKWDDVQDKPDLSTSSNASTLEGKTVAEIVSQVLSSMYPVGSIYMSMKNTSPAEIYGGTWERLKDRFLLGAGDTFNIGEAGGVSSVTLTLDQIPAHSHTYKEYTPDGGYWWTAGEEGAMSSHTSNTSTVGSGQPHENMPPYVTCYMWQRIA